MRKLAGQGRKRGEGLKRTLRLGLAAACLLALAAIAAVRAYQSANSLLGAALAGPEQIAAITALPEESAGSCVLHWNGEVLPYDAARNIYCLPQPLDGTAVGGLSASWGSLYLPADQWAGGWQEAMETGEARDIYVSDGRRFCRLQVYVSGLPALVIHTDSSEPYRLDPAYVSGTMASLELYYNYGEYTLFWPQGNSRQRVVSGYIEHHWRGNTNLLANKKSYRLNLLDERGRPQSEDLLGLGEDADWFLLNFATDTTRARDKVAWQLWAQLAAENDHDLPGIQVEYLELYLDDTYMGVYGLARPISRDSLALSAQDVFYKWRTMPMDRSMPAADTFDSLEEAESLAWGVWLEVVWPKTYQQGIWQPMADYVELYYTPGAQSSWEQLEQTTNLDNLVDVSLFRQFVCAADNFSYNQYFLQSSDDGLYYRIPWDMDYTFGDVYDEFYALDFTASALPDMELDTLYAADPDRTRALVAQRWQQLRQTVFTLENVEALFAAADTQLHDSGALARDAALWGQAETYPWEAHFRTLNIGETLEFMEQRLAFLDEYYAAYTPASREAFDVLPK